MITLGYSRPVFAADKGNGTPGNAVAQANQTKPKNKETNGKDTIVGTTADDLLLGGNGKDTFILSAGADTIVGGNGNDNVIFDANSTDYTVSYDENGNLVVTDIATGSTTTLEGIDVLNFADGSMDLSQDLAPVAVDDSFDYTPSEDQTSFVLSPDQLLANDSELNGEAMTISALGQSNDGSVTFDENGNIVFTPNSGFYGTTTFTYSVSDPAGNLSTASVSVTVNEPVSPEIVGPTLISDHETDDHASFALNDGGYLLLWNDETTDEVTFDRDRQNIVQRYDAAGNPVGEPINIAVGELADMEGYRIGYPDHDVLSNGNLLIEWYETGEFNDEFGNRDYIERHYIQIIDKDGNFLETAISSEGNSNYHLLPDGGFFVLSELYDPSVYEYIRTVQRYDDNGTAIGEAYNLPSDIGGDSYDSNVSFLDNGTLAAFGRIYNSETGQYQDSIAILDHDGTLIGTPTSLNILENAYVDNYTFSQTADGGFMVSWTEKQWNYQVQEQTYISSVASFDATGALESPIITLASGTVSTSETLSISIAKSWSLSDGVTALAYYEDIYNWATVDGTSTVKILMFAPDGTEVGSYNLYESTGIPWETGYDFYYNRETQVLSDGRLAVVVRSTAYDDAGQSYGVRTLHIINSDGTPANDPIEFENILGGNGYNFKLEEVNDGSFILAWDRWGTDTIGDEVVVARYDNSFNLIGGPYIVDDMLSMDDIDDLDIEVIGDGNFLVTWNGRVGDSRNDSFYSQILPLEGLGANQALSYHYIDAPFSEYDVSTPEPFHVIVTNKATGEVQEFPYAGFVEFSDFAFDLRINNKPFVTGGETISIDPLADGESHIIAASILLANDWDIDGDQLHIESVGGIDNGSITLNENGDVVFTPLPGFEGIASFNYTVSDGNGGSKTVGASIDVGEGGIAYRGGSQVVYEGGAYNNETFALNDGGYIIKWHTQGENYSTVTKIQAFNSDGSARNDAVTVPLYTDNLQVLSGDRFLLSWNDFLPTGSVKSFQVIDGTGQFVGGQITTSNYPRQTAILNDAQEFAYLSQSSVNGEGVSGNFTQISRFDINGEQIGANVYVENYNTSYSKNDPFAILADGSIAVLSTVYSPALRQNELFVGQYGLDGQQIGDALNITNGDRLSSNGYLVNNETGGFHVVWQDYDQTQHTLHIQSFDTTGNPLTADIAIATSGGSYSTISNISTMSLADGQSLVQWRQNFQDLETGSWTAQRMFSRIDEQGSLIGEASPIGTSYDTTIGTPKIEELANGSLALTWVERSYNDVIGQYTNDIKFQMIGGDGVALNQPTSLGITPATVSDSLSLTPLQMVTHSDSTVSLYWTEEYYYNNGHGNHLDLFAQNFGADGQAIGEATSVLTYDQDSSSYSPGSFKFEQFADGSTGIFWSQTHGDWTNYNSDIYGLRLDQNLEKLSEITEITHDVDAQYTQNFDVDLLADGNLIATWGIEYPYDSNTPDELRTEIFGAPNTQQLVQAMASFDSSTGTDSSLASAATQDPTLQLIAIDPLA